MALELKINVRHTDRGSKIRSITQFNNFKLNQMFNGLADTFSFDFLFDPKNQDSAETVCVSHMHECTVYYNGALITTGYILNQKFLDDGKPNLATISGYSKAGALNDCDTEPGDSLETNGMSLRQIIEKLIQPFNLKLLVDTSGLSAASSKFISDKVDEDYDKTASEVSQNIGSYISDLAKQKGIVLSHNQNGDVKITKPNTGGIPLFNFDFTSNDPNNDARKIPVIFAQLEFNGGGMHNYITVVQQADDERGTNASTYGPIKNPLIPIGRSLLYRPRTIIMTSGDQFTAQECCYYEMGKEVRDNVKLKIKLGVASKDGVLISPNNTLTFVDPSVYLYKQAGKDLPKWFIESVDTEITPEAETCTLNCVLPFGYDFDFSKLTNVFVNSHENLPRF